MRGGNDNEEARSTRRSHRIGIGLHAKLVASFVVLGIGPFVLVGILAVHTARQTMLDAAGDRMMVAAVNTGETIDRNLFERYGDVQAFAANPLAQGTTTESTDIADFFMTTYGVYDLMVITDAEGIVRSVNSVDAAGAPVESGDLVGLDLSGEPWFAEVTADGFPTTATAYGDAERSPLVEQVYGDQRITLGFSAPIRDTSGEIVGTWHNQASFERIVGSIVEGTREELRNGGVDSVTTQLVDRNGVVLDASTGETPLTDNLVDLGLEAASRAVEGATGVVEGSEASAGAIYGFAPADGALGFDGYGWGVIVGQERSAAMSGAKPLQNTLILFGLIASAVIVAVAVGLARSVVGPVRRATQLARASALTLAGVSAEMGASAERTSSEASAVSESGALMSQSLSTVASAVVELDASFRHVADVALEASVVAGDAVEVAQHSAEAIARLETSSEEIAKVVELITSIAIQTNLLALNATIEAARTGEAGRGFVVVANEVKDLARRTAEATDDISSRVGRIHSDTVGAVAANRQITTTIDRINEISNTIALAVEEQTVTTSEISRSLSHVSSGTSEISRSIRDVAATADTTRSAAAETRSSSASIAEIADSLQAIVSG